MKVLRRLAICAVVLMVASTNVFAEGLDVSAQMDYTFDQDSDMGAFGIGDGDIVFSSTQDDIYYEMELEFKDTGTENNIEEMFFAWDISEPFGFKAGKFGTAWAPVNAGGTEKWGVEIYGGIDMISYEIDVVNGTDDNFEIQPVLYVSPVEALTLNVSGLFDLGEDTNNAAAAGVEFELGAFYACGEIAYVMDSEKSDIYVEADYTIAEGVTPGVYYEMFDNDSENTDYIGVQIDYTPLAIDFCPSFEYYIAGADEENWAFNLNFEYDFSL